MSKSSFWHSTENAEGPSRLCFKKKKPARSETILEEENPSESTSGIGEGDGVYLVLTSGTSATPRN